MAEYYATPTKMRSSDRVLKLALIDDKASKGATGLVDPQVLSGNNKLHAKMDPQTCFWSLNYDAGIIPQALRVNFTSFPALKKHAEDYFRTRNIKIEEVID